MTLSIVEHKTASEDISLGSSYWQRLRLDAQVSTYIQGAKQLGYAVEGVLYDVLRKPAQRPLRAGTKDPETPEVYGLRVFEAIRKDFAYYYQRQTIVCLESEQLEARKDAWATAKAIRTARNDDAWPRTTDACKSYGRDCDYLPVCTGETSLEDPIRYVKVDAAHTELEPVEPNVELLTQSSMRCFRACQRRYQYRYEELVRLREPATALKRGASMHRALEVIWKGGDIGRAMGELDREDLYEYALQAAMLAGYVEHWGPPPGNVIAVEKEFRVKLLNPETGVSSRTFLLGGKLDGLVEL